jgi:transposase
MSRVQIDPLRPLLEQEREDLEKVSRSRCAPAAQVARAQALLAVAAGQSFTEAALLAGRRTGDTIRDWVSRFNRQGVAAVVPRHGGGPPVRYGDEQQRRILAEVERSPDREQDGTATWSLSTLQNSLRQAPHGLPTISTYTIWTTLHRAGLSWQRNRTWCETGMVTRQRKHERVVVQDRDAEPKKS